MKIKKYQQGNPLLRMTTGGNKILAGFNPDGTARFAYTLHDLNPTTGSLLLPEINVTPKNGTIDELGNIHLTLGGIHYMNGKMIGEVPVSNTDPLALFYVEGTALSEPLKLLGRRGLYALGKYGSGKAQNWARAKLISDEMKLTNPMEKMATNALERNGIPKNFSKSNNSDKKSSSIEELIENMFEMDKALAFSKSKLTAYDLYNSPIWTQRMRNAGFTNAEIQEAKDIYFRNLRGALLQKGKGNITDNSLGEYSTNYEASYLDDTTPTPPTSEVSISVSNMPKSKSGLYLTIEDVSNHEVVGHTASGSTNDFPMHYAGLDDLNTWAEWNPTLWKIILHNEKLLPRFNPGTSSYHRLLEEVRARVVGSRETIKKVLRKRYPLLEYSNPKLFEYKVNSAFRSMINKRKNHGNSDILDILDYYNPLDILVFNEYFLKRGGTICTHLKHLKKEQKKRESLSMNSVKGLTRK